MEGFVVRTQVAEPPAGEDKGASPYKPGSSFFFKVKFDEPYMMYRDWREVTRTLLSSKGPLKPSSLPKSKMKRAETRVYVKWVIDEITKDRASFSKYGQGKGIIATREKFLEFLKTPQGAEALAGGNEKDETPAATTDKFSKTIIVPVAIPGCGVSQIHFVSSAFSFFPFEIGKTSVSLALAHIFGFGHTQSDDVHVKKSAPAFIKNVVDLLRRHDVVIADKCVINISVYISRLFLIYSYDRNNHLKQHRQSLRDVASKLPQSVRLLALNWSLDQPPATIHRICGDRVQERGDNHQTLRADMSSKSHEEVIWMFINSTQELTPNEVDNVVEMELGESMEDSVKRAVEGCVAVMGLEMPSDEKIQEALDVVKGYAPAVKKPDDPKDKKKKLDVRYYGLLAEVDLTDLLDRAFANEPQTNKDFWTQLKTDHRVTKRPHVTIVHRNSIDTERELWDRCTALYEMSTTTLPLFKGTLSNLVWNDRVMAITLEDFDVDMSVPSESQEGGEFVSQLPDEVRARLHITVGTGNGKIQPVEAKTMVQQWRRGEELDKIKSIKLDNRIVYGRIKGLST